MSKNPNPMTNPGAVRPRLIAVAGGSGSGKTTFVERLKTAVGDRSLLVLSIDHYYRDLSPLSPAERDARNFDHPDAFDMDLMTRQLTDLVQGRAVERPTYDFATHTSRGLSVRLEPTPVIVLDGILALHWPELRQIADLKVFVDVDDDVRFIRRLRRDVSERGRTVDSVIGQYMATVKGMHDVYVAPQKLVADIIVSWMDYNDRAVAMVASMARGWIGSP